MQNLRFIFKFGKDPLFDAYFNENFNDSIAIIFSEVTLLLDFNLDFVKGLKR